VVGEIYCLDLLSRYKWYILTENSRLLFQGLGPFVFIYCKEGVIVLLHFPGIGNIILVLGFLLVWLM